MAIVGAMLICSHRNHKLIKDKIMAATFTVEDGSIVANANSLISVTDADQINLDYENNADWIAATQAIKERALRLATRYLNLHYTWDGYKVDEDQTCQWPRYEMWDEDGNAIDFDIVHENVKQACVHLAIRVISDSDTLIEDFQNESRVKRTKDVIGPITKEREYMDGGESPEKTYQLVDKLITSFVLSVGWSETDIVRG